MSSNIIKKIIIQHNVIAVNPINSLYTYCHGHHSEKTEQYESLNKVNNAVTLYIITLYIPGLLHYPTGTHNSCLMPQYEDGMA